MAEAPPLVPGFWPRDLEMAMFNVLWQCKPVGAHRHFAVVGVQRRLRKLRADITCADIWAHLNALYDMNALEELNDAQDFGNASEGDDEDFSLPTDDKYFSKHVSAREGETESAKGGRGRGAGRGRGRKKR